MGDQLDIIDGYPAAAMELDEVRLALRGNPGDLHTLGLRRDATPFEVDVAVDRLLPVLDP